MSKNFSVLTKFLFVLMVLTVARVHSAEFHVSPNGSPNGDGSAANPWDLETALRQPSAVHPGDIIWLHGGTYHGTFQSTLLGTPSQPIIVRQAPNERATIDGGDSQGNTILLIGGAYTWYWGFEVTSSNGQRVSAETGSWPTDLAFGECIGTQQVDTEATGCKLINLIVHDGKQGLSLWMQASDFEAYGCVIYYNGWMGADGPHGHGVYAQNQAGSKLLNDNLVLDNFSEGIQIYGSSTAPLNNFTLDGNVVFGHTAERNILLGGSAPVENPVVTNNFVFDIIDAVSADIGWNASFGAGVNNAVVNNNYLVGRFQVWNAQLSSMSGNTIYGSVEGFSPSDYPSNTFTATQPSDNMVSVRPNKYEAGRANVVVYNWTGASSVQVDLSGVLSSGDQFVVVDAQNYFGSPVVSGTYDGKMVTIPLGQTTMAPLVGNDPRSVVHTPGQFAAYVVEKGTSIVSGVKQEPRVPEVFALRQNYPNPFNPSTTINFSTPSSGHVSLVVYNVIGQEVRRLVDRTMAAGEHTISFDAVNLPSGMYLYELRAGSERAVRKMILMK